MVRSDDVRMERDNEREGGEEREGEETEGDRLSEPSVLNTFHLHPSPLSTT